MSIQVNFETNESDQVIVHWADMIAERIIKERTNPDGSQRDSFVCASGITPSGTVHIGNFREIISVDLVVRALRKRGKQVRFIYSWDDYDVFRKVPKNMPNQEMLIQHLRWPIVLVPDPYGEQESYARHHEVAIEKILPKVGVEPEYIYQAQNYRSSRYAHTIKIALEKKDTIEEILNEFRTEHLEGEWWPISVFSNFTNQDTTTVTAWDGEWQITYQDDKTKQTETVDLRTSSAVKLPWRIDWPMRWSVEGVDFEPAGKDHHSQGGSWSTAEKLCEAVYGIKAPISFQYDFISIKGRGGKISSSSGEVIDLYDVLEVFTAEIARYMFAGTRPNTEFSISFDLDVIKIYEDYDRTERLYYGLESIDASHASTIERTLAKEKRIYELSQVADQATSLPFMPLQIPFRQLCNLLLTFNGDLDRVISAFPGTAEARAKGQLDQSPAGLENMRRLTERSTCAWNWLKNFAPEDFTFTIKTPEDQLASLSQTELHALHGLQEIVEGKTGVWGQGRNLQGWEDKELQNAIYQMARERAMDPKAFFQTVYKVLIGKTAGPRLAGFLKTLGKDWLVALFERY